MYFFLISILDDIQLFFLRNLLRFQQPHSIHLNLTLLELNQHRSV